MKDFARERSVQNCTNEKKCLKYDIAKHDFLPGHLVEVIIEYRDATDIKAVWV